VLPQELGNVDLVGRLDIATVDRERLRAGQGRRGDGVRRGGGGSGDEPVPWSRGQRKSRNRSAAVPTFVQNLFFIAGSYWNWLIRHGELEFTRNSECGLDFKTYPSFGEIANGAWHTISLEQDLPGFQHPCTGCAPTVIHQNCLAQNRYELAQLSQPKATLGYF